MKNVYLDNNATTPLREEVLEAMLPFLRESYGNPSSIHSFGKIVRQAIDAARETVANALGVTSGELYFTTCGTESNNIALKGLAFSKLAKKRNKIVVSSIEHPCVQQSAKFLVNKGFNVCFLPVKPDGIIDIEVARREIDENTLLVSTLYANNEIGTIQPVAEIGKIARENGALFHVDAVQALGKIPFKVSDFGADMLTVSAHKIYGPKGTAALYIRKGLKLEPLMHGGHQEKRMRPGTENPAGIIGFGKAVEEVMMDFEDGTIDRIRGLRDRLQDNLMSRLEEVKLNGHKELRVPNTVNISFKYIEGESLLLMLDNEGIAVSTGSACSSGSLEPSHVITSMGIPAEVAHGSIRFSLSRYNTQEEIDYAADAVVEVVNRLREFSPLWEDFKKSKQ